MSWNGEAGTASVRQRIDGAALKYVMLRTKFTLRIRRMGLGVRPKSNTKRASEAAPNQKCFACRLKLHTTQPNKHTHTVAHTNTHTHTQLGA